MDEVRASRCPSNALWATFLRRVQMYLEFQPRQDYSWLKSRFGTGAAAWKALQIGPTYAFTDRMLDLSLLWEACQTLLTTKTIDKIYTDLVLGSILHDLRWTFSDETRRREMELSTASYKLPFVSLDRLVLSLIRSCRHWMLASRFRWPLIYTTTKIQIDF